MSAIDVVRHVLDDGTIHYRNAAGELHRTDGPAIVRSDGTKKWYLDGKCHREDGPAVVYPDGGKEWYLNGVFHREDGPAAVYPDGSEGCYLDGELHREDGPAVVYPDGGEEWYQNGKRHREDGPAVVRPDGSEEWYQNGKCHREDGPALVYPDILAEFWYLNGVMTRLDGPAFTSNGKCDWVIQNIAFAILYEDEDSESVYIPGGGLHLPDCLVEAVMTERAFATTMEFVNWLVFVVLGEEAIEVMSKSQDDDLFIYETERLRMTPVIEEYLRNHRVYEGLPFSWWYSIVEGRLPLS